MRDAYKLFMEKFDITVDDMIDFGINETIYIPKERINEYWQRLKLNIFDDNDKVYVRGYGRDAKGTNLYMALYKELFGHDSFFKDPTNNTEPTKTIRKLSGYSRQEKPTKLYKQIRNYQVSHIFGRTKNPFLFNAPWNIVYVPKVMDPFTGHESKGELTELFQEKFKLHFYNYYLEYIEDYNSIMLDLKPKIDKYLYENDSLTNNEKFVEDALIQFSPINLDDMK